MRIVVDEEDTIVVSDERAKEIEAWCESALGYDTGPEYAKYAVVFVPEDLVPPFIFNEEGD